MNRAEEDIRSKYNPDYSGMDLREYPFATMENHCGNLREYCLDLMTAEGSTETNRPVVFFVHGGGFTEPCDKRQAYIPMIARHLVKQGYAVVSPDYPVFNSPEELDAAGGEPAGYQKAGMAIHLAYVWLREHRRELNLDCERIAIIGGSAGGWASYYAIADHRDLYRAFVNCWGSPRVLPSLIGFPPTLSIHGTLDSLVPYALEEAAQNALRKAGVVHELITLDGCGHTPLNKAELFIPRIISWLNQYL